MVEKRSLENIAAALTPRHEAFVSKWFGMACLKVEGKVFAVQSADAMAFKLPKEALSQALEIEGACLFDPRSTGHPMKEWVQIPAGSAGAWQSFARAACEYVAGAAEAKKDEVISGLIGARRRILEAAAGLAPQERGLLFLGEWSVKELVAHLIGWDYTNLEAVRDVLAGHKPAFWSHYDRDWQSYNALLVARYGRDDWAELVAAVHESHRQLIDYLRTVPADEYLRKRKIVSLLQVETRDEKTHHQQIVRFGKRLGSD
jgi:hypothetical protein